MSFRADYSLKSALDKRKDENSFRYLQKENELIDFCSNDYLGFARSESLLRNSREAAEKISFSGQLSGSTGSRLIRGNNSFTEKLEEKIAEFHHAESGLLFNSGYMANTGVFSSVAGRNDVILYDELVHASIHDGIRLSKALHFKIRHNSVSHLSERLEKIVSEKRISGNIYVAVESLYSMDGDFCPLAEFAETCARYGAHLIVDEAHSSGIFGENGEGLVVHSGLQKKVFARIHTFGKALGCHGAIVLGSHLLRNYLVNFCRPFIYTTTLPLLNLITIEESYNLLYSSADKRKSLADMIALFSLKMKKDLPVIPLRILSPIQSVYLKDVSSVKNAAFMLQNSGMDVRAILHPTVPSGKERLRICIHSFNTEKEINSLVNCISGLN